MKFVLTNSGTGGDLQPFVGVGRELRQRGHEVTVLAVSLFRPMIENAGLQFADLGADEALARCVDDPDLWHPQRCAGPLLGLMRDTLEVTCERIRELGPEVIVGGSMAVGAKVARDLLGLPMATLHLQPHAFGDSAEARQRRDEVVLPTLNRCRAQGGLELAPTASAHWLYGRTIGLFPDWFAPGLDAEMTGFPLEEGVPRELPDIGQKPVLITFGTGMKHAREFLKGAADALRGRPGILLTRYPEQLPSDLPANVRHFDFLPFPEALEKMALVVHHGGVGTVSQALRAGVPQLVVPFAHDQPGNAKCLAELGVAEVLPAEEFTADRLAGALDRLTSSPHVATRVAELRERTTSGLERTATLLEAML